MIMKDLAKVQPLRHEGTKKRIGHLRLTDKRLVFFIKVTVPLIKNGII